MEEGYIYDKLVFFVQDIVAKPFSLIHFFCLMALFICNNVGHIRFPCIKHVKSRCSRAADFVKNKA